MFRFFVDGTEENPLAKEQAIAAATPEEPLEEKADSILEEAEDKEAHIFPEINFEMVDTGRWLLKVIAGPNNGAEFSMEPGGTYLIGTDPNICDIVFHDTSVSRQHGKITMQNVDDTLFIEDLKVVMALM